MNIIDMIRIRINPNVIDNYEDEKINSQIVLYALSSGYKFNPETFEKFFIYSQYRIFFKNNEEMKNCVILRAKKENSLNILYKVYDKEIIKQLLINDKDLRSIFIKFFSTLKENFNTDDLIDILGEKTEEIELLFTDKNHLNSERLKEIIIKYKEPKKLQEKGLLSDTIKEFYINSKNPEKTLQLIELLSEEELLEYKSIIMANLKNLTKMYSIINSVIEIYKKLNIALYSNDDKFDIIQYFIDNVEYEKGKIPLFVLQEGKYHSKVLVDSPELIFEIMEQGVRVFDLSKETKKQIADRIREKKIHFDELPLAYSTDKDIFESAASVNEELCKNSQNTEYIGNFIEKMTDEEVVEYYKSLGIPFNSTTVKHDITNIYLVLECLKNDYMTLRDTEHTYTIEEYKKIAEVAKHQYTPEQILENKFLRENPFLAEFILKNARDLKDFNPEPIKRIPDEFDNIKQLLVDRGYSLEVMTKSKIILEKDGTVIIEQIESFQDIIDAIMYMQKKDLNNKLIIILKADEGIKERRIISDNIKKLREYQRKLEDKENPLGITEIEFKYTLDAGKTGDELTFSLKQMIKNEERLEEIKEDILRRNFSPLEKYIAVYDFVKNFRRYKMENTKTALTHSRALYEVIDGRNDCIVCKGYCNLMERICKDVGLDVEECTALLAENHAVTRSTLVDPKYGIVGAFTSDPTNEHSGYEKMVQTTENGYTEREFLNIKEEKRKQLEIPPQTFIEAIINVNKSYSKDLTDKDIIDLKMYYSIQPPFGKQGESCYGKEAYNDYIQRTYEEIKAQKQDEIIKNRPMLDFDIIMYEKGKEKQDEVWNIDDASLNEQGIYKLYNGIQCYSRQSVALIQGHKKMLEDLGFSIFIDSSNGEYAYVNLPSYDKNLTIEEYMEKNLNLLHKLKVVIGLEKEEKSVKNLFKEAASAPEVFKGIETTEVFFEEKTIKKEKGIS